MNRRCLLFVLLTAPALACETSPAAPTVIPGSFVPAVATTEPYRWDTRDELTAWVGNGVSTGPIEVVGDAADAVIRIRLIDGDANLHGPDCDPRPTDVQSARVRYRWIGRGEQDSIFFTLYLRPIEFDQAARLPLLRPSGAYDQAAERAGGWTERALIPVGSFTPPFSVRFAALTVDGTNFSGPGGAVSGIVEIDWIALVR